MPLSRTNRIDRRRRVLLDAVASEAELATDTVRAKKRTRTREAGDAFDDDGPTLAYRDPGYSQAVRKTCQQRMVQLIPVRRGTLTLVLSGMWTAWVGLLLTHYLLFVYGPTKPTGATSTLASFSKLPIAQLFDLRSAHGISHWLTSQLWMLTALAAWMIFQLRRHKLDDYRARYRVWVLMAVIALFSSFDSSSSGLYLLGLSIDGWARKEIGYGGWPLVLASFASIVGVLGIRLCNELKSAPMSVASWLAGLLAWAASALLGTGLFKTNWNPATLNLIVGALWLGGILAVFQAAGIYLRQTYIQAQKRFLERQGANLKPIQLRMPKNPFRRSQSELHGLDQEHNRDGNHSRWRMPWSRTRNDDSENDSENYETDESSPRRSKSKGSQPKGIDSNSNRTPTRPIRLFGLIPHRSEQNERLESDPIREDEGPSVDQGLTKARGWFGIGGNRVATRSSEETATKIPQERPSSRSTRSNSVDSGGAEELGGTETNNKKRRFGSLWSRTRSASVSGEAASTNEKPTRSKRKWIPNFGRERSSTITQVPANEKQAKVTVSQSKTVAAKTDSGAAGAESKRSWMSFVSRKNKTDSSKPIDGPKANEANNRAQDKPPKRSFLSMFDGFRLKPPADEEDRDGRGTIKPIAIQAGQSLPSTQSDEDDADSDEGYGGRPMSKAERKKLRRMQQDDRRAA